MVRNHQLTLYIGGKLPLLFIVKGLPGGVIESRELQAYPAPHVYAVQENVWMDDRVWCLYMRQLLTFNVDDSSVLLVDNLECHVSEQSHDMAAEANFSVIEPLPPNSTRRCQPLDVGPLKAMLKTEWLREDYDHEGGDTLTAQEKRAATIHRTIRVWEKISSESVKSAFEKSIPSVLEV
ncbi:hypothetical protein AeNC1_015404 [Aphanomyces euteiches]|nr:hypothetical protein AeNC1_015404 [Aphanomyces euteiches]